MISQATCSPCPMLKMLNGIQSMEFFIKSSTWCPSFSTSVWEYMLDSHCQRWLLTKRHLYSIVNPVVRYLASWLALEHIPPLLNQGLGRDPLLSLSSGVRGRRWTMQEQWIIFLTIGHAFVRSNYFSMLESLVFAGELWNCAQYRRVGSRFRPIYERSSQMLEHDCETPFL